MIKSERDSSRLVVKFFPVLLFIWLMLSALTLSNIAYAEDRIITFYDNSGKTLCSFKVELAVTPEEQAKGLMYRKSLKPDAGMLFIFNKDEMQHFWMKNTLIPLDLVFITARLDVASIHGNAKPLDETSMASGLPVKYVLEINAGKVDHCKIKIGSKVKFKNIPR